MTSLSVAITRKINAVKQYEGHREGLTHPEGKDYPGCEHVAKTSKGELKEVEIISIFI